MSRPFTNVIICVMGVICSSSTGPATSALIAEEPHSTQFTRFYMPQTRNANSPACLDGSAPAIYFRPGTGDGVSKWILYHQGGGWCTSNSDCENRSHSVLGSSTSYPPEILNMDHINFLSMDKNQAPSWYNWNQLYMKYCDGASFSGDRSGTVLVNNTTLYYRGYRNLRAMMKWALEHGLGNATDLLVSGGSAGGLATFLHTAEWCHVFEVNGLYDGEGPLLSGLLKGEKKCVGVPDAGFFPDIEFTSTKAKSIFTTQDLYALHNGTPGNYAKELRWVYNSQNVTVNHLCQAHFKGQDESKCMFAEHTAPFITQPILVLNSIYDSWQIGRELPKQHNAELVNKLGRLMVDRVTKTVLDLNPKSGAWLTACSEHTVFPKWLSAEVDGVRAPDVIHKWYSELDDAKSKRAWIAEDKFPCACATCCDNYEPGLDHISYF